MGQRVGDRFRGWGAIGFICARLLLAAVTVLASARGAEAHIGRARQTFTYGAVIHDFDLDGQSNAVIDIDDFDGFAQCFNGPDFAPLPGCEVAQRQAAAVEAATERMTSVAMAQMEAGVPLDQALSPVQLSAVVVGDYVGATPLMESVYDVDLATNTTLSDQPVDFLAFRGDERFRRALQGGGQLLLTVVGSARSGGARAAEAAPVAPVAASALRARVLTNIAESAAARGASRFEVYAAREAQIAITRATQVETRSIVPYFPANRGFIGATERRFLMPGQIIDRYGGSAYSRFFSPAGTPAAARALPPSSAGQALRVFEIVKPFEVEAGTVAPAFGQLGFGEQLVTPVPLEILLRRGIIREITPTP